MHTLAVRAKIILWKEEIETGGLIYGPVSAEDLRQDMVAYTNDMDGYYKNMALNASPQAPTWRIFAQILAGALIDE